MITLRTLLAATDLSAPARHAALRAALLARDTDTRLELLYVVEGGALEQLRHLLGGQATPVEERLLAAAHEDLTRLAAEIGAPVGVSPGVHLSTGPVLQQITAQADALDVDLLVLGARGAGFMRHLLLGATAERLLRKTLRPLLVVKQVPHERYRRVLVPVDFSPWSLQSLHLGRALAPGADFILFNAFCVPFEGKLRLAGVEDARIHDYRLTARQNALRDLQEIASAAGLQDTDYHTVTLLGDAVSLILEQEEEQDIDLIVMGKHGKGMIEELLLGSVTKHILAESHGDVLVVQR